MTCLNKKLASKSAAIEVEDILVEIFLCLPLNSIERFKTTCKKWQSLLTDPAVRKLWRKRNLKPSTGLILGIKDPKFVPFSPCPNNPTLPQQFKIIHSCNGLLLCSSITMHEFTSYHVYNPTTGTSFTLPNLGDDVMNPASRILTIRLAFDPNRFGPHYKVVCFVRIFKYPRPQVYIYSSNTRTWDSVSKPPYGCGSDEGVYWNGAIHWVRRFWYFDIENDMFKRMPKLPDVGGRRIRYHSGESCDRLNCTKLWEHKSGDLCSVDVYELKRDYSEWVLKYRVDLDYGFYGTSVLSVVHGVEEDDSFLVLKIGEEVMRYNIVSQIIEKLPVLLIGGYIDRVFQYIECRYDV